MTGYCSGMENILEGLDHKNLRIFFKKNNFQIIENIDMK